MADFEIIEADFQQFYHLNLSKLLRHEFCRCTRLLLNLPEESRFIRKYSPFKDWDWDKEIQSQILRSIDSISVMLYNSFKGKGKSRAKRPELVQPDYVKEAKKEAEAERNKRKAEHINLDSLKEIFENRNNKVKKLE